MKLLLLNCFLTVLSVQCNLIPEVTDGPISNTQRKIIIDTDAGGDDAVGILLALRYELKEKDVQVLAITCTYGNTEVTNVEINVEKILTVGGRSDIPIYSGADKPLIKMWEATDYFGKDGMNGVEVKNIDAKVDRSKHAAIAMIELVKKYPGQITIIALGPTTNLALAISLDPTFASNVGQFVVMGSTVTGWGNVSPGVDFNFGCDPDSNAILMKSSKKPVIIVPREVSRNDPMYMDWRRNTLGKSESNVIKFLNEAEGIAKMDDCIYWSSADPRAVAIALWEKSLVTDYKDCIIIPVREGEARGSVLVEHNIPKGQSSNAKAALRMDIELFKKALIDYLN